MVCCNKYFHDKYSNVYVFKFTYLLIPFVVVVMIYNEVAFREKTYLQKLNIYIRVFRFFRLID